MREESARAPADFGTALGSFYNRGVHLASTIDHHLVASVSIAGTCLDVLGTLYLAYDLLGGEHGPLRLVTRAETYSIVFGVGYGLGLGLFFGAVAGATTGVTIAIELHRAARHHDHYSLPWEAFFAMIRGVGFGVGLYHMVGLRFAVVFAVLVSVGPIFAYSRGMRPGMEYEAAPKPHFSSRQFWGTVVRTLGYGAAALLCGIFAQHLEHPWLFALRVGLVTGFVTGFGIVINPYIEYYADHLPERILGALGIGLILCGFALQSFQYWVALLDVHVT
jgi:hypothetical protein